MRLRPQPENSVPEFHALIRLLKPLSLQTDTGKLLPRKRSSKLNMSSMRQDYGGVKWPPWRESRCRLVPVEHHYLVTEDIPEIQAMGSELPQINDGETNCYVRQEGQGMLIGAYETPCVHWSEEGTPLDFGHELLPDDLSRMEWHFEKSMELMPCLASAGIKRVINGPMIFSPDLGPLLGPHPSLTQLLLRKR